MICIVCITVGGGGGEKCLDVILRFQMANFQ